MILGKSPGVTVQACTSQVHEDYGVADQDTNQAVVGLARTLHVLHHDGAPRGDNSWFLRFEQAV